MAGAEQNADTNPRDLFQRFNFPPNFSRKLEESIDDEETEIELSLGLSSNGRFGFDPKRAKILSRSSSVSDFMLTNEQSSVSFVGRPLMRTCSLPTESEEDWRKRKEIQLFRRGEAKRKRVERMRNLRRENNCGENSQLQSQGSVTKGGNWGGIVGGLRRIPSSQGSIGSRGSGSSGISESGCQPNQGINGCTEARSPASVHSLPKQNEHKPVVTPTEKSVESVGAAMENPSVKVGVNNNEAKEITRNMMADMPCVSTRGLEPNGGRIEGFLYRYRKGEEVRIVCVCHGSFLSPAEFVRHAGGGDVAHPLKHIVVNPSPLL